MRRLGLAERSDLPVLDQDVVERDQQLTVRGRPVVRLARGDEDVSVQPHLLAIVLTDVRVVPVRAGVGHVHLVREALAERDRCLRVMRAVVAVFESQPVPVNGRVEVAVVDDMDGDRCVLRDLQSGAWDGAVVRQHAHGRITDPFLDGLDLELELVTVGQLDDLGRHSIGQSVRLAREFKGVAVAVRAVVVHRLGPFVGARMCRRTGADGCARSGPRVVGRDPLRDEFGVFFHPADQRRASRVLPRQAEEVETGDIGHASAVTQATVRIEDRHLHPRVVRSVARRPDDGADLELAAILEAHGAAVGRNQARTYLNAVAL